MQSFRLSLKKPFEKARKDYLKKSNLETEKVSSVADTLAEFALQGPFSRESNKLAVKNNSTAIELLPNEEWETIKNIVKESIRYFPENNPNKNKFSSFDVRFFPTYANSFINEMRRKNHLRRKTLRMALANY